MSAFQKSHSYLIGDEEKAESGSISSFGSKSSIKRSSYNGYQYIAISPDGTQIVTLNTSTHQLKLCKHDNLSKFYTINYDEFKSYDKPLTKINWSLAVSNAFTLADGTEDVLIVVSCFDDDDMKCNQIPDDEVETVYMYDDMNKRVETSTWIISCTQHSRVSSSINKMGGIVKFLDIKDDNISHLVLINALGITKFSIEHETIREIIYNGGGLHDDGWSNLFFSNQSIQEFHLPPKFFLEMQRLPNDQTCTHYILQSLIKDRFVVETYKNKVQTVEMYNLETNSLENTFQKREESAASVIGKGSPCFAISKNEVLFAYCRGTNSITIYLMENGLEVTTKKFKEKNFRRIIFFDFVQDDNQLLLVIEEERFNEDDITQVFVVWDLFSSSDYCVRKIDDTSPLFPEKRENFANASGNLFTVTERGDIISILKESEIVRLLNPVNDFMGKAISLEKFHAAPSLSTDHYVYDSGGNLLDFNSEYSKIIIYNSEPWVHDNRYKRISAYLDDKKSIQLIIGKSTVQVWRKRRGGTAGSSPTRILEFIWAHYETDNQNKMEIQSLAIGNKEFSLTLRIPSGISPNPEPIKLEWPEKVNYPKAACQALEFLDKIKNEPSGPKRQHQFENLVQQTEYIINKCLIKKCGLWRMLDIRFDIMANLIRGNRVTMIKNILSLESHDGKYSKHLHTPRIKSWNGTDKEFTDLEIAIECTKGGYRKDTVIVKYLLDYYSDNAAKTSNWMFTVTKAIPFLYKYQLEFYVKELFQKPCFGANEVYLEKSSIRNSDMTKSSYKNIHALNVDLSLVKREKNNFLQRIISQGKQSGKEKISNLVNKEFKTPSLINQVYMVPLPDFTVYPEGIDDKREEYWKIPFKLLRLLIWPRGHIIKKEEKLSPFLRMIRNDNSAAIYDNPSIAAVIDFKWNAARKYFLRHVVVYFVFALTYALLTSAIKGSNRVIAKVEAYLDVYLIIANVFFYWLGFYILNTERVQLKYDGWKRYFSVYNFFDLFSVILPLITATIHIFELEQSPQDFRKFTILNSFTILTMWMELFLLLRYFEKAGAYIFIIVKILQEITSFLTFILLVVLGFGHAMFVLLNNTSDMNLNAEGTSFKIYGNDGNPVPEFSQYVINQEIDVNKPSDNYYTNFVKSIEAVFFWTSGRWDQLDQWDFWPVDVYSMIASILLVTILQNMLIAIMTGAYEEAKEDGRHAVLKYRAELIADYETVDKPLGNRKGNPRYIYFIGKSDYIEEWLEKAEKARESHKNFLAEIDNSNSWYYDDDEDDEETMYYCHTPRTPQDLSYGYSISSGASSVDSISINSQRTERQVPLSINWFVDEDERVKDKSSNDHNHKSKEEVKTLQDKVQSMEQDIKYLITLIQNQK
ncbi:10292_t:CDS:2 [Funneliformis mosseae]|uniref:10292_t:CDS:1 n=1 Tax=Funneliformis mosseae TaxID=27381 RepID=A0A9N9D9B4_FUNMO|nr:10292_t:CDS:2 [Funneliformis mosseae]